MHFFHFCLGFIASTAILAYSLHHDVDHLHHVKRLVKARCDAGPKSHGDLHHHSNTTHKHSCCAHGCGEHHVIHHPAKTTPTTKGGDEYLEPTKSSTTSSNSQPTDPSGGGASQSDISTYLAVHNTLRRSVWNTTSTAFDLTWSDTVASVAQRWANKCVFEHSNGTLAPYGENLAAGTGDFGIQPAIQLWSGEEHSYHPSNPQASHYTQMVWKATTQLGCAVASCNGIFPALYGPAKFYVCEYNPPGNVDGEFGENVPN